MWWQNMKVKVGMLRLAMLQVDVAEGHMALSRHWHIDLSVRVLTHSCQCKVQTH
jgi:hypothetical protein